MKDISTYIIERQDVEYFKVRDSIFSKGRYKLYDVTWYDKNGKEIAVETGKDKIPVPNKLQRPYEELKK